MTSATVIHNITAVGRFIVGVPCVWSW